MAIGTINQVFIPPQAKEVYYSGEEWERLREQKKPTRARKNFRKKKKSGAKKKHRKKRKQHKNNYKNLPYHKLLKLPQWKKKRKQIFTRDNFTCQVCGAKTDLQVHHKKYISGRLPWQYNRKHLITLCSSCHEKEHPEIAAKEGNELLDKEFALRLLLDD